MGVDVLTPKKSALRYSPEQVALAIRDGRGMLSVAARALGCTRQTVDNYLQRHPACRQARTEAKELLKDTAELQLVKAIQDGEAWAICFYLKTQAKDRGYVERAEVTGADNGPVRLTVEVIDARRD
jgi:hypothetical protein